MLRREPEEPWRMGPGPLAGALIDSAQVQVRVLDHLLGVRADPDRIVDGTPDASVLAEHGLTLDSAVGMMRGPVGSEDRRRFRFELGDVASFQIRSPFIRSSSGMGFRKKPGSDATWEAIDPPEGVGALRQQEITNMVLKMADLQAAAIGQLVPEVARASLGLDTPEVEVALTLKGGETLRMSVGRRMTMPGGSVGRMAIVSGRLRIIELRDTDVSKFRKDPTIKWFDPAK